MPKVLRNGVAGLRIDHRVGPRGCRRPVAAPWQLFPRWQRGAFVAVRQGLPLPLSCAVVAAAP